MATCTAFAERYVGKGKDRTKHAGPCGLDAPHEGPHVPLAWLQAEQAKLWVSVPRDELDLAKGLITEWVESFTSDAAEVPTKIGDLFMLLTRWGTE